MPPGIIWRRTLDDARELSRRALTFRDELLPAARAYGEVAFGGAEPKTDAAPPWDTTASVEIPDTGFRIAGYIDRLDISGDGTARPGARLQDRAEIWGQYQSGWRQRAAALPLRLRGQGDAGR